MTDDLRILIKPDEMRSVAASWRHDGKRVAFVPTMGALHAGHLALVKHAATLAEYVVVSIFVNPLQFGPREDFAKYPRPLKDDVALLQQAGVAALFLPTAADMYPENFHTRVGNIAMAGDLCGRSRPGHFEGVLTVVNKLLNIVQPHMAVFGKKDYQQWRLIERMVLDLCMPVTIVGLDTVREADGLAMSSRNRYLDSEARQQAVGLSKALQAVQSKFAAGERRSGELVRIFEQMLADAKGFTLDYIAIRRQQDLSEFGDMIDAPAVALAAAMLGDVRLLDNLEFSSQ